MLVEEGGLLCVGFGEVVLVCIVVYCVWIEWFELLIVFVVWVYEVEFGVEYVCVVV